MNQIVGINDWCFFLSVSAVIVFQRIVGPVLMKTTPDEAAIAAALPMARPCIVLAPQLDFFAATPEGQNLLTGTRLEAWLERMNARPSTTATQRPEEFRRAA